MTAARQIPPTPPDHLRSVPTSTRIRPRRSPAAHLARAGRWLAGPATRTLVGAARKARDAVLILGAIGLLAWAGYLVRPELGAAVAGVGLLVLWWAHRPTGIVIPVERLVLMLACARDGMTDAEILPDVFGPEPVEQAEATG